MCWPSAGCCSLFFPQVPDIMSIIHSKLEEVDEEHIRKAAQQTVYILASQHKSVVVSSLLGSSLPFDRSCPALPRWPGACMCSRGAWASERLSPKLQIIFWLLTPVIRPCWNFLCTLKDQHGRLLPELPFGGLAGLRGAGSAN